MILGVGVDMVEIERVARAAQKPAFLSRVYTERERAYFGSVHGAAETIAAGFAAKEAVAKALGTGFSGMSLHDIEVLHDGFGKPRAELHGGASKRMAEMGGNNICLSITHEKRYAIAFAVVEG